MSSRWKPSSFLATPMARFRRSWTRWSRTRLERKLQRVMAQQVQLAERRATLTQRLLLHETREEHRLLLLRVELQRLEREATPRLVMPEQGPGTALEVPAGQMPMVVFPQPEETPEETPPPANDQVWAALKQQT